MLSDCIFCKIINQEISSTIIKENEHVIVVNDISPKAPIHYLIFPKKHIKDLRALPDSDNYYAFELIKMAKELSKTLPPPAAFNLVSNNGREAGQSVFHLHWHFLSGKNIYEGGFTL